MEVRQVVLVIGLCLLFNCVASHSIELLPEYNWETRQDWPPCCQYSSVVRALLCSDCSPPLDDIPDDIPDDCWVVDLSFNNIPFIGANKLSYLDDLFNLVVSHNRIGLIESGGLSDLSSLTSLEMEDNLLTAIPELPVSLQTLKMQGNPVDFINGSSLSYLTSLNELTISAVELGADTFSDLGLTSLDISTCNVQRYAFRGISPAFDINLINPCPEYLSAENVLTLEPYAFGNLGDNDEASNLAITIRNTTIPEIPYRTFYQLGSSVTDVQLLEIDGLRSLQPEAFTDNSALVNITIDGEDGGNDLTLYPGIFQGMHPNLKKVDFSNLGLVHSIHAHIFDSLEALTDLYLDGLGLDYMTPDAVLQLGDQLEILDVGNNPYVCNCHMEWLRLFFESATFDFGETTTCGSPPNLQGQRIDELEEGDLVC